METIVKNVETRVVGNRVDLASCSLTPKQLSNYDWEGGCIGGLFSKRFGKNVWITHHARESMLRRGVDAATLEQVIEEGEIKRRDELNLWVFRHIQGRADNLICCRCCRTDSGNR